MAGLPSPSSRATRYTTSTDVTAAKPLADANAVEIAVAMPQAPVRISLESELVERILQPLLENACQYGQTCVQLTLEKHGRKALISISDDGPGITADEQETIFDPGVRGQAAHGRSDGSGLGLALALRVARSAGGNITAQPSDSGGHFLVELPLG